MNSKPQRDYSSINCSRKHIRRKDWITYLHLYQYPKIFKIRNTYHTVTQASTSISVTLCHGPASRGIVHSRAGANRLEMLDKRNRDVKEKKQRCRVEPGGLSNEYQIFPHLFFICLYIYPNPTTGKKAKDYFNMKQRTNRAISCFKFLKHQATIY